MKFKHDLIKCTLVLFLISCQGPEGKIGPSGKDSIVKITEEQPASNCPNGGQKITSPQSLASDSAATLSMLIQLWIGTQCASPLQETLRRNKMTCATLHVIPQLLF